MRVKMLNVNHSVVISLLGESHGHSEGRPGVELLPRHHPHQRGLGKVLHQVHHALHLLHRLQPSDLHRVLLEGLIRVLRNVRVILGDVSVVREISCSLNISQGDLVRVVGVEDVVETLGDDRLEFE